MRLVANLVLALSLAISFVSPTLGRAHQGRRHHVHDIARRDPGEVELHRRDYTNCRFTYYAVGLGACGVTNGPNDFIVALSTAQFDSSYCFQMITITVNGKTTQAQIMDSCPGCPPNGLDFSLGLFTFFADTSVGVLTGSWSSGSSSPPPPPSPSPPPPPPPPSPSPSPSPTSVNIPLTSSLPSPTTTSLPPPTTTSSTSPTHSGSTITGSNSTSTAATQTTNAVSETAGAVAGGLLINLETSIVFMGRFLGACAGL